jgi:flagellar hook-associated protein 1 FlgK
MVGLNSGLYIGLSGVRAAQGGLSVTGNNIANVNTEGYSRQMTDQTIAGLLNDGNVTIGRGTDVRGILGARDQVAERTLRDQESRTNYYQSLHTGLDTIEDFLNETEFSGVNKALGEFFETWESVSTRPDQTAARQEMLASGEYLAGEIRQRDGDLNDLQLRTNVEIADLATEVNQITAKILDLNGRIYSAAQPSQDLIDQRNEHVNELSEKVGVDVFYFENNRIQVNIKDSNLLLVGTESRNQLRADINPANNNFNDITLVAESGSTTDVTSSITSGELGAKLELRDTEIVGIRRDLDNLAAGLITSVNALHTTGFDLNGNTTLRC